MPTNIKLSLKLKVVLQNLLIVVLFAGLIILVVYLLVFNSFENFNKSKLTTILEAQSNQIEFALNGPMDSVKFLSRDLEIIKFFTNKKSLSQEKKVTEMLGHFATDRKYANIYLMDESGNVIVSIDKTFLTKNFSFRNYFKLAIGGQNASQFAFGTLTKKEGFYFSSPVKSNEKVLGVVVVKVEPAYVFDLLNNGIVKTSGHYMMTDSHGVVIKSDKDIQSYSSLGTLNRDEVDDLNSEKTFDGVAIKSLQYQNMQEALRSYNGNTVAVRYVDEADKDQELLQLRKIGVYPYYLILESSLSSIFAEEKKILTPIVVVLTLAVIIGISVQYILFSFQFSPLAKLEKFSKGVIDGVSDGVIDIKTGDELESLADSMMRMVERLKSSNRELAASVDEKTVGLSVGLSKLALKNKEMNDTEEAMINLLEDSKELEKQLSLEKSGVEAKVLERTAELSDARAKLASSIESLPLGFLMTDLAEKMVVTNNLAEKVLGSDDHLVCWKKLKQLLKEKIDFEAYLLNKDSSSLRIEDFELDGRIYLFLVSPILVNNDGEKFIGLVVLIQDITEEKIMERSKDEFFSIASHELRTPLTAIRGNTSMIQEYYKEQIKDPELASMISDIHDSSVRLIDIVNDFLNISRLEQGKMEYSKENIKLEEVVPAIIKENQEAGMNKDLSVTFIDEGKKFGVVVGDLGKVKQVLINLIGNALKFTTKGGVKISLLDVDKFIKVLVTDTGRGISVKQQSLLFHKFQQAGESLFTRDTVGGTGLGLYISKKMIEGMGGEIKLERSEEGIGSTFSFTLPKA